MYANTGFGLVSDEVFIEKVRQRIAMACLGPSALRNQGKSVIDKSRQYFASQINLKEFRDALPDSTLFSQLLDEHTRALQELYYLGEKGWGVARKALNLFFREAVYNSYLAGALAISVEFVTHNQILANLEIPLDSHVGMHLLDETKTGLPDWKGIKYLTPEASAKYQGAAQALAEKRGIARVHLTFISGAYL